MARITIENEEEKLTSLLYEGELVMHDIISFLEQGSGAKVILEVKEDGMTISRTQMDVETKLYLFKGKSYGTVTTVEGTLPLEIDCLEYRKTVHKVFVRYRVQETFCFTIDFRS